MNVTVACADVGSIKNDNSGWRLRDRIDPSDGALEGDSIDELVETIVERVEKGRSVALGFECPLFIPVREPPPRAHQGAGGRWK